MVLKTQRKADHGTFRVTMSPAQEDAIIQKLVGEAEKNTVRPGHGWCRLAVEQDGRPVGFHEFHVDLPESIVEVWETWDGVETARRTYELVPDSN